MSPHIVAKHSRAPRSLLLPQANHMVRQMEHFLEFSYIYLGYGVEAIEGVWKKGPEVGRSLGEPSVCHTQAD